METKLGKEMMCHAPTMDGKLELLRQKRERGTKLKVGVFGLTGCAGCQLTILFGKEKFFNFISKVDVLALPFIKEQNYKGKFDVIILEGLVASKEDKERAEELRQRCDVLMCIGACAVHGCVPAMKNFMDNPEVERAVYAKIDYLNSLQATPVSKHVPVDIELPGCPPDENQIYAVLTDLLLGRPPRITHNPVCVECVKREVDCLLIKGKPCLGPITTGGCDAICTVAGHECMGCRGPTDDANLKAFITLLTEKGYRREDIEKRLHTYAGLAMDDAEKAQGMKGEVKSNINSGNNNSSNNFSNNKLTTNANKTGTKTKIKELSKDLAKSSSIMKRVLLVTVPAKTVRPSRQTVTGDMVRKKMKRPTKSSTKKRRR